MSRNKRKSGKDGSGFYPSLPYQIEPKLSLGGISLLEEQFQSLFAVNFRFIVIFLPSIWSTKILTIPSLRSKNHQEINTETSHFLVNEINFFLNSGLDEVKCCKRCVCCGLFGSDRSKKYSSFNSRGAYQKYRYTFKYFKKEANIPFVGIVKVVTS